MGVPHAELCQVNNVEALVVGDLLCREVHARVVLALGSGVVRVHPHALWHG